MNINDNKKIVVKKDLRDIFPAELTNRQLIGKFIDYILNVFFQTSSESYINGYIGKKTIATDLNDQYLIEPSIERQNYQLSPLIVTNDGDSLNTEYVEFSNFINTLKKQGCNTINQNRLLSDSYWSWAPPINIDMFVNYNFYYWLEQGTDPIILNSVTDINKEILHQAEYTYRGTIDNNEEEIVELQFISGMRVIFKNDINTEYNNKIFLIEAVGQKIILVDDTTPPKLIEEKPNYITMERGCIDENQWSKQNRWFHRSVIRNISSTTLQYFNQAKKPIICFNRDLHLYDYGKSSRGSVDLLIPTTKNNINGLPTQVIQGVKLQDGMKILITGDSDDDSNNRLYFISGIESTGVVVLQDLINGADDTGKPLQNEGVSITQGTYANRYFYFNDNNWVEGQQKITANQEPLFMLYDKHKIELNNPLYYPQSTFRGSKVFSYQTTTDITAIFDTDLDMYVLTNGYGNFLFNNDIAMIDYTYQNYNIQEEITGFKYLNKNNTDEYINGWFLSDSKLSQYITTEIYITDDKHTNIQKNRSGIETIYNMFDLSYQPIDSETKRSSFVYINGTLLNTNMYIIENKILKIENSVLLNYGDIIYIKLLVDDITTSLEDGYFYDLPLTLISNTKNEEITSLAYNETYDQFKSIIENQENFLGFTSGDNNFNSSAQNLSLGTEIVQHSTPIIKSMILNSKEFSDVRNVILYNRNEYTKFKSKFYNIVIQMSNSSEFTEESDVDEILKNILNKINIGKVGLAPFYNNGVASDLGDVYIPATPSYLGLAPNFEPKIEQIPYGTKPYLLLGHDGSYNRIFNDYRDAVLLRLEEYIYNSINTQWKNELPKINFRKYQPSKFRTSEYSRDEYSDLLTPIFEKWCQDNNIDYTVNEEYDYSDPFTWNWSGIQDKDGYELNGNYKSIYMEYFDTFEPHLSPWKMLGFGSQPSWWEEKYGSLPYTSSNYIMWNDIEKGYIADGSNKGFHPELERPGLFNNFLPVDTDGNLLNPFDCGIATSKPIPVYAEKSWKIGDLGKAEHLWHTSSEYHYDIQTLFYLLKPLYWVEQSWNILENETIFKDTSSEQIINSDLNRRITPSETFIHNEVVNNEYIKNIGTQQWFSDYLVYENIDITMYIGNPIRNMDMNLSYRCAGFYKKDSLRILSDNYGVIPTDNYHMDLYKSITDKFFVYSAMVIEKVPNGYVIDGFDYESPYFNSLIPERNGKKTNVEANGRGVTYYNQWTTDINKVKYKSVYYSIQDVYDIIIGYGKFLQQQGWEFIVLNSKGELIDFRTMGYDFLLWATLSQEDGTILLLNPAAQGIKINHDAFIDKIGKNINGYWSVLDTAYNPIYNDKLNVVRKDGETIIESTEMLMTMVKCNVIENEHILIFDNQTIFGDTLYNPLLCIKTPRLKLIGIKVNDWSGNWYSPGYLIEPSGAISNYDKMVDDFRYFYDTDDVRSQGLFGDYVKKTIGYVPTTAMEHLLIDNRNMFDFYKGTLKQKGTAKAFNKLNRSTHIMGNQSNEMELYETWAFKASEFGNSSSQFVMEFKVNPTMISQNPQIVSFTTDNTTQSSNTNIVFNWDNENWLKKLSIVDNNTFRLQDTTLSMPTGGIIQPNDVSYIVSNKTELLNNKYEENSFIWVITGENNQFELYKYTNNDFISYKVNNINELLALPDVQDGDIAYVTEINLLNEMFRVDELDQVIQQFSDDDKLMKSEENIINKITVAMFKYNAQKGLFNLYRCQVKYPNIIDINSCFVLNDETNETITEVQLYDPLQKIIPNNVLDEVHYITPTDPVSDYTNNVNWTDNKVGFLWWDLSKVKYLNYYYGSINERRNNWGKQLPGSEIAIYEWVKSSIKPTDGSNFITQENWDNSTSSIVTNYFYWSKNPSVIPTKDFRKTSALQISKTINSPQTEGIAWVAPIYVGTSLNKYSSFIIGNIDSLIAGDNFVIQFNFKIGQDSQQHVEWVTIQEGFDQDIPQQLWEKTKQSLIGYDNNGLLIPDMSLPERDRYGIQIRPRQSMFKDLSLARQNLTVILSNLFASRNILVDIDVDKPTFASHFLDKSTTPSADLVVSTYQDMIDLQDKTLKNKLILVLNDEKHDNIWTLWEYISVNEQQLKDYQMYDVSTYWQYEDLYKDELTQFIQPVATFETELEFITTWQSYNLEVGDVIKFFTKENTWILKEYQGDSVFYTVGLENGTISINDKCYSFLNNETLKNSSEIFIDGMTRYDYLIQESATVIKKILLYFEI